MTSGTISIPRDSVSGETGRTVHATPADTNAPPRQGRIPLSIARDQLYYWTARWQEGEAESLADVAEGRSREFDNFVDLASYLLGPEDTE